MSPNLTQEDRKGIRNIVICTTIIIFLGILSINLRSDENFDHETLCLLDQPLSGHTVFFVDRTDPLNKKQTQWLLREIEKSKSGLTSNEKLSIFSIIGSNDSFLRELFSRCSPGSGKEANPLYQNPKKIQKYFEESFGKPLTKKLDTLTQGTKYSTSPIMESIKILLNQKEFSPNINNRKLYIVSDMLQNTQEFSHYRPYNFGELAKANYFKNGNPNLDSVEVRIYYVANNYPNARIIQNEKHRNFWLDFFNELGAKVELTPISYLSIETPSKRKNVAKKPPSIRKDEDQNNQQKGKVGTIVRRKFIGTVGIKKNILMELCYFSNDNRFRGRFKEENTDLWFNLKGKQNDKDGFLISLNFMRRENLQGKFIGHYVPKKGIFSGKYQSAVLDETFDFRFIEQKKTEIDYPWSSVIEKFECINY